MDGAAGRPHSRAPGSPTNSPAWPPQHREGTPLLSQGPKDELGGQADVHGTGWTPSPWTCARGQMPDANRFCHRDTEGLDAHQLPLPRDRLRERRRALSKIDERCQKMISPPRTQALGGAQIPAARPPGVRAAGRQPAASQAGSPSLAQLLPGPGSPQFPGERKSRRGPLLGGTIGKQGALAPPGESGSCCLYPFYSTSTDPLGGVRSQGPVQPRHKQWLKL